MVSFLLSGRRIIIKLLLSGRRIDQIRAPPIQRPQSRVVVSPKNQRNVRRAPSREGGPGSAARLRALSSGTRALLTDSPWLNAGILKAICRIVRLQRRGKPSVPRGTRAPAPAKRAYRRSLCCLRFVVCLLKNFHTQLQRNLQADLLILHKLALRALHGLLELVSRLQASVEFPHCVPKPSLVDGRTKPHSASKGCGMLPTTNSRLRRSAPCAAPGLRTRRSCPSLRRHPGAPDVAHR